MIFVFLGFLSALITVGILYSAFELVKMEAEIKRVEKKRKVAAIDTLKEVKKTLKTIKDGNGNKNTIGTLQTLEETIRKGIY